MMSIFNSLTQKVEQSALKLIDSGTAYYKGSKKVRIKPNFDYTQYIGKRLLVCAWVLEPTTNANVNTMVAALLVDSSSYRYRTSGGLFFLDGANKLSVDSLTAGYGNGAMNYLELIYSGNYSLSSEAFHYEIYLMDEE